MELIEWSVKDQDRGTRFGWFLVCDGTPLPHPMLIYKLYEVGMGDLELYESNLARFMDRLEQGEPTHVKAAAVIAARKLGAT